ncbi:methyltransferase [Labilithrix luteola]|nr:methyltransferase [Labilithrix luteola]
MAPSTGEVPLTSRVRDPGFTPSVRDLPKLLELIGTDDEELATAVERAVLRIETQYRARVVETVTAAATAATRPARGRLAKLVGRLATGGAVEDAVRAWLLGALRDADPKTRRTAARSLGKLKPRTKSEAASTEKALLEAWDAAEGDDDRRALTEALGKIGSREALAKISQGTPDKVASRAAVMIERAAARENPGRIDLSASRNAPIRFHTRAGLEGIVAEELGRVWKPELRGPGVVEATLDGPLASAAAIRTATHVGFPLARVVRRDDLAESIVETLLAREATSLFETFTKTGGAPIRFRLAWAQGGHRRALAWRCAELVRERTKTLVNDPTDSTWEVVVDDRDGKLSIELVPRGFTDERFAYRTGVVPASSHPTIAAALARVAPRSDDDVVWDPFVGAGAELVERARLGPAKALFGTDIEDEALAAARKNLENAGVTATLHRADALTFQPSRVTLIITNPPMGRRVQRGAHTDLLERFVSHAAKVLVPGGAIVWTLPEARKIQARAEQEGFTVEGSVTVDMGGFPAELCVYRLGGKRRRPAGGKT